MCSCRSRSARSRAPTSAAARSKRCRARRRAGTALAVSPNGRYYAIGREDGSVDEYDARTLRLIRHHELANPIKTLVFSPDSSSLAVEDTSDVVRVWDSCEICENPTRLARRAAAESVRSLTPGEQMTFDAH